jgi:hypothetical protein
MKKYFIGVLLLSIFTSCTEQPKCDSDEALQLAKDLIKQELKSDGNSLALEMFGMGDENTIDKFVDENIELKSVRTTEKNDELKTCSCASQITFKFSEEFEKKMKENGKDNIISSAVNDILSKQIEYYYNLQILEKEKNLYIEGIVPKEELTGVLTNYTLFAPKNETKEVETGSNESQSELTPEQANSGEITTAKSYIYKDRNYSSKTKMYLVKGDVFDIGENKDGFYDIFYRAKNDKYIEGFIPEDEIRLLYLDKYGTKTYINQ